MDFNSVLLMGEGLHHKSCFVPFLGSRTMLVLKGHKIPLLKAGELLGVLVQELLLSSISLGKGHFSPLPGECPFRSGFVVERRVGQVILDRATIDYFCWGQLKVTTGGVSIV